MLFSVDPGRSHTKGKSDKGEIIFPSFVSKAIDLNYMPSSVLGDMILEHERGRFFIGDLARREGVMIRKAMLDTKVVDDTLFHVLGALYQMGVRDGKVRVVTGVPIRNYTTEEVTKLKKLLGGEHKFYMNGEKIQVTITDVYVTVECGAAFWLNPQKGVVRIIDAGAKTVNWATYEDGIFINRDSGTVDKGWDTNNYSDAENMAAMIIGEIGKGWDRRDKGIIIGGRISEAKGLEKHIREYFPNIRAYEDPQFATVRGYHEAARISLS